MVVLLLLLLPYYWGYTRERRIICCTDPSGYGTLPAGDPETMSGKEVVNKPHRCHQLLLGGLYRWCRPWNVLFGGTILLILLTACSVLEPGNWIGLDVTIRSLETIGYEPAALHFVEAATAAPVQQEQQEEEARPPNESLEPTTTNKNNHTIHVSLVLTYCSGDLQWLQQNYTQGITFDYTYVAVKCGIEPNRTALPADAQLVQLPNVGGCDHTMAYWMSEVLPTLPAQRTKSPSNNNNEVVLFLKDAIHDRNLTIQQDFQTLLDLALSDQAFGCLYLYTLDSPRRFYQDTYKVRKFRMKRYVRDGIRKEGVMEGGDQHHNLPIVPFKSPFFTSLRAWQNAMNIQIPRPMVPMCYGGMFMVKRSRIEQVPIPILKNITYSLSRGNNIEEGHFAERTWAALLMDKDYIKKATIGMEP